MRIKVFGKSYEDVLKRKDHAIRIIAQYQYAEYIKGAPVAQNMKGTQFTILLYVLCLYIPVKQAIQKTISLQEGMTCECC